MITVRSKNPVFVYLLLTLMVFSAASLAVPPARADITGVSVSPTSDTVARGDTASYHVSVPYDWTVWPFSTAVALGVNGAPPGASISLSSPISIPPSPPGAPTGTVGATLRVGTSGISVPYCGVVTFTMSISAAGTGPPGSSFTSGQFSLSVVGECPINVEVRTDKSTYKVGETITITVSVLSSPVRQSVQGKLTVSGGPEKPAKTSFSLGTGQSATTTAVAANPVQGETGYTSRTVTFEACSLVWSWICDDDAKTFEVAPEVGPITIGADFPSRYEVEVRSDGAALGKVSGGSVFEHDFPCGSTHTFEVTEFVPAQDGDSGVRYRAATTKVTLSLPPPGAACTEGIKHTFHYEEENRLDVATDPGGLVSVPGAGWYRKGAPVSLAVPKTMIEESAETRHVFKLWEVDGVSQPEGQGTITVTVNKPLTAKARFQTEFFLQLLTDFPKEQCKGEGWYSKGSTASFSCPQFYQAGILQEMEFVRWSGDYEGTSPSGSVVMDSGKTLRVETRPNYRQAIVAIGVAAFIIAVVGFIFWRRTRAPPAPPPAAPTPPPAAPLPTPTVPPPPERPRVVGVAPYCPNCQLEYPPGTMTCEKCGRSLS